MKRLLFVSIAALILATGCTQNQRAKRFGGSATQDLPAGQQLVNVTWKDAQMWILTKPMEKDHEPVTYTFKEKSSYGMIEGTVKIVEHK